MSRPAPAHHTASLGMSPQITQPSTTAHTREVYSTVAITGAGAWRAAS